jgi:hypothetical protein
MRAFELTPDDVLARSPGASVGSPPNLGYSIIYGALSFCAVSLIAYSPYTFALIKSPVVMYSASAVIYIVLTGVVLSRLVLGPGAVRRFAVLFGLAFLAYAFIWCAFWFGLKGRYKADLWGSAAGLALLTLILQRAFGQRNDFLAAFGVLFAFHTLGYYLGEIMHNAVRQTAGKLLWGVGHGLGFGAGLGYVLFHAQLPLKSRLTSPRSL